MNKALFAIALLALVSIGTVMAYKGDPSLKGPYFDEERHESMQESFESADYEAWYALMTEDGRHPKILDKVTEDNFEQFAEMKQAFIDGDFETGQQLREELGFGMGMKKGWEQGRRMNGKGFRGQGKGCQSQNQ